MTAAHGLRAWLLQRFTAVYLAAFFIYLLAHFTLAPPATFADWRAWMAGRWVNLGWSLFVLAVAVHAWVGIRDVVMDYVHPPGVRVTLLGLIAVVLAGSVLWGWRVLFIVAAG